MAGRTAIRKALVQFFLSVDGIRQEEIAFWSSGDFFVVDTDVTLTLASGTTLAFPVTCSMRWRDGLIQEAIIHMYLESRLALAMARFDRIRGAVRGLRKLA